MPCSTDCRDLSAKLPKVNIFDDPGIWVCLDEGCNSNCHGNEWADNTQAKLEKLPPNVEHRFRWLHQRERNFNGIGTQKVVTKGKRQLPCAMMLQESQRVLPLILDSHEQEGRHPMLLSDSSQARLGMVKDMRAGVCYLKDYNDYL